MAATTRSGAGLVEALRRLWPGFVATMAWIAATWAVLAFPGSSAAQTADDEPRPSAARAEDVADVGAILGALYEVISGGPGEERDWDRFRSLFLPEARLIPAGNSREGRPVYRVWSVEDYVTRIGPRLTETGFFEREISRVEERFGNVAHAFSTYESRRAASDPEPFTRGINSVQLFHDGDRWWIVSILFDWEREDQAIPEKYLKGRG